MRELKELPKIELHCHLDGSIRPQTIFEILKEKNIKLETDAFDEFKKLVSIQGDTNSLVEYLDKFNYPIMALQTETALERVTYELLEDLSKDGVKYAEIRFAPSHHTSEGLNLSQVIEASLRGMNRGIKAFDIDANLIISLMRHLPIEKNIEVIEVSKEYLGKGVVACDLAGNEVDFPPLLQKATLDLAHDYGFAITIHAGETGIFENIVDSVNSLHATRIGHGLSAIKSEETMNLLRKKGIYLEICPTSNLDTKAVDSIVHHPIIELMKHNILITLNTDNTTVSNITLTEEIRKLVTTFNLDMTQYIQLYKNAVYAAFTTVEMKKKLLNHIEIL